MNKYIGAIILAAVLFWGCDDKGKGFFSKMPSRFKIDSLAFEKDLFNALQIQHLNENQVRISADGYCDVLPFCGVLKAANDTIFFREAKNSDFRPYLLLEAKKFDTLLINYFGDRQDRVVSMGKMPDRIFNDSISYFQLIPVRGRGPFHKRFVRYIAIKEGGIRYITFSSDSKDYTVMLSEHPKIVWRSDN